MSAPTYYRRAELEANLVDVRGRIEAACEAAGRRSADVTLIAVTKTWPTSDVRLLAELGVTEVGENRHQELETKAPSCTDLTLTWHFVGQLQTNKSRSVATHADVVHSVDRDRLVTVLAREADRAGRGLTCLVQVDLDERPGRGGAPPEDVERLADTLAATSGLVLGGVMAMAPLRGDPAVAFARLAAISKRVQRDHPAALTVSAGMSGDLESAIAHGATHLRIGTALLGSRDDDVG